MMAVSLVGQTDNKIVVDSTGGIAIHSLIRSDGGATPLTILGGGGGYVEITNAANSFSGTITLAGAEARFSNAGSFGNVNNTIVVDGGRLATAENAIYTIASSHSIQLGQTAGTAIAVHGSGGTLTYNGVLADKAGANGILVKQGAGKLVLGGGSNTYSGGTFINGGTLAVSTNANLGNVNGALSFNGGTLAATETFATARGVTLNAGGGTIDVASGKTLTASGIVGGAGSLTKTSSGTLVLGNANTFSGATNINNGV